MIKDTQSPQTPGDNAAVALSETQLLPREDELNSSETIEKASSAGQAKAPAVHLRPIRMVMQDSCGKETHTIMYYTSDGHLYRYLNGALYPARVARTVRAHQLTKDVTTVDNIPISVHHPDSNRLDGTVHAAVDNRFTIACLEEDAVHQPSPSCDANLTLKYYLTNADASCKAITVETAKATADCRPITEWFAGNASLNTKPYHHASLPGKCEMCTDRCICVDIDRTASKLSPNFTITSASKVLKSIPSTSGVSLSLTMGAMGKLQSTATIQTDRNCSEAILSTEAKGRQQGKCYPNIKLPTGPVDHPLLDHDYCYEVYCQLVAVHEQTLAGRPAKRKYKTKRISALGKEIVAKQPPEPKERVDTKVVEWDTDQRTSKTKVEAREAKGSARRKPSHLAPGEEAKRPEELRAEPVKLQGSAAFQDQFVYFATRKITSRTRSRGIVTEPLLKPEAFWKDQFKFINSDRMSQSCSVSQVTESKEIDNQSKNHEMNEFFTVLGMTLEGDVSVDTSSSLNCNADGSWNEGNLRKEVSSPAQSCSISSVCLSEDAVSPLGPEERIFGSSVASSPDPRREPSIDELLQTMTEEQISQVILALETNAPSSAGARTISTKPQVMETLDIEGTSEIPNEICAASSPRTLPSLVELATRVLDSISKVHARDRKLNAVLNCSASPIDIDSESVETHSPSAFLEDELSVDQATSFVPDLADLGDQELVSEDAPGIGVPSDTRTWNEEVFHTPIVVPVCMYWNTFPGLSIDGQKYLRLVDIHRQALPSKDTGLLKKRAQMLGHEVLNCTDMQRNLLVRYAFAAPSRSTLIVNEQAAAAIIKSYMEPRDLSEFKGTEKVEKRHQLPMSQTAMDHDSIGACKKVCSLPIPRASRLRQVKASYRRFLKLGKNRKEADTVSEGSISDPGYHSDHSPEQFKNTRLKERHLPADDYTQQNMYRSGATYGGMVETAENSTLVKVNEDLPSPVLCSENEGSAIQVSNDPQSSLLHLGSGDQPVHIRHVDFAQRKTGLSLSQNGDLYTQLFKSLHSPCIQCCQCQKLFAVKAFTRHQHHNKKLVKVKVRQRLEARGSSIGSQGWEEFKQKKDLLQNHKIPMLRLSAQSETVTEPSVEMLISAASSNFQNNSAETLGKRVPKRKHLNPDEVYYTSKKLMRLNSGAVDIENAKEKTSNRRKKSRSTIAQASPRHT